MTSNLLTAAQAAKRLGVRKQTLYAYVSRGVLTRTMADDATSRFDAAEIDKLARRGRPRKDAPRVGRVDVSLATSITNIQADRLLFRGRDASALAASSCFEAVAELLWTGELPERASWPLPGADASVARAVSRALPAGSPAAERLAAVTAALACTQPLRVDLRPASVAAHARALLTIYPEVLPLVGAPPARAAGRQARFAERLWPRLSPLPATPARVSALDATLILLADHELATSTLAARVAASTRADPFSVVLAGLGAISGPLHGRAALAVHELLLDAASMPVPAVAVARLVEERRWLPGFGHPVYRGADPRQRHLAALMDRLLRRSDAAIVEAVLQAAQATSPLAPNVDFALGALAFGMQMPVGSTAAIFAVARTAGFIAHALEEYAEDPLRFRASAIYVGASS